MIINFNLPVQYICLQLITTVIKGETSTIGMAIRSCLHDTKLGANTRLLAEHIMQGNKERRLDFSCWSQKIAPKKSCTFHVKRNTMYMWLVSTKTESDIKIYFFYEKNLISRLRK